MTNSTDKKSKKGILRTGAILPVVIFVVVISLFSVFFFDNILKYAFINSIESINGAEVNIAKVETNFKNLRIEVKGIKLTNKDKPEHNLFEIDSVSFGVMWDAVLRAKLVIDLASIKGILVDTKRTKVGYVIPKSPSNELEKQATNILDNTQKELDGNIFGDISSLLSGNSNIASVTSNSKSAQVIKEMESLVELKEKEIKKKISDLPTQQELKTLEKEIAAISWKDLGNISKAPKVLKESESAKKKLDLINKRYQSLDKSIKKSQKEIDSMYRNVDQSVNDEVKAISKKLNIPKLDAASISSILFGSEIKDYIGKFYKYKNLMAKYIPERNKEKKEKPRYKKRQDSRIYQFPKERGYPTFWVKNILIESQNQQGFIKGKLTDLTSNQKLIDKETVFSVKANIPAKKLYDGEFGLRLDAREKTTLTISGKIAKLQVKDKKLSDSEEVRFNLAQASNQLDFKASFIESNMDLKVSNLFTQIKYDTFAKSKQLGVILKDITRKTKKITLDATAKGQMEDLKIDVRSNLGAAVQQSVGSLLKSRVDAATKKIKNEISEKISAQKKELEARTDKIKKTANDQLAKVDSQIKGIEKKLKKESSQKSNKLFKGIKL